MNQTLRVIGLEKSFVLHHQGGTRLDVLRGIDLDVAAGECLVLHGPSGRGKSTLLRTIYGNYRANAGRVLLRHEGRIVDIAAASPRLVIEVRRRTIGYVSQFLRVIPRVSTLDIVARPLHALGMTADAARSRARAMLARVNIPEHLWQIAPATFSGGEQQRINVARGFVADYPILLLDEPMAALDTENARIVAKLIDEARDRGASVIGVFHDAQMRRSVATRIYDMPLQRAIAA